MNFTRRDRPGWLFIGAAFFFALAVNCMGESDGVIVSLKSDLRLNGLNRIQVVEIGTNALGKYRRVCLLDGKARNGVIRSVDIERYHATTQTERKAHYSTYREPLAGYILLFLREGSVFADIELLERSESFPFAMSINGVHRVRK